MAETFQRPFNPTISTQGEVAKDNTLMIRSVGQAAQTVSQGLKTKWTLDALEEEKSKEDQIRTTADRLMDEADAMQDQDREGGQASAAEVERWLTQQKRNLPPAIQDEVQALIARGRAQGGLNIRMTQEDLNQQLEQELVTRVAKSFVAEGINPRNYTREEMLEIGYQQNRMQTQLLQQQQEIERINAKKAATDQEKQQATSSWLNQVNSTMQVGKNALALKVGGIDSSEEYMNLLDGQETLLQQTRARVKQRAEQQLSLLQDQDTKEALVTDLERSMKGIDDQIAYINDLKEKPLKDAKREVELLQTKFLQKHPQLDIVRQIISASQFYSESQAAPFSQFLQKVGSEILSDQQSRDFASVTSNPQATQQDFEGFYDSLGEDKAAELSLEYHKVVVDGYKGGSGELFNQASNSLLYIASRVNTAEPEQAQELFKLMANGKEALYKDMDETQKRLFDYKITQSARSAIGNSQTGLLAGVATPTTDGALAELGIKQDSLLDYKDGKFVLGASVLNKKKELEQKLKGPGFLQSDAAIRPLRQLNQVIEKTVKQLPALNSIVSNTAGLDTPALKNLTDDQRIAYLTSNPAGISLSDYSNIPAFTGDAALVEEGIQRGKAPEDVLEERTEKQQVQAFNNATALLYQGIRAKDGAEKRAFIGQIKQLEGLDPQVLEEFSNTLETQAKRLEADSVEDAAVTRAEKAQETKGRPASQEALPAVEEDSEFIAKTQEVAGDINASSEDLLKIVQFETSGSFDPAQGNKEGGSAVGLIQFMPEVIEELGTTREDLVAMTRAEQMDVVGTYLKRILKRKGVKNPTLSDLYMAVLRPESVGQPEDSVVYKKPSTNYEKNKVLDTNKDGTITKAEATEKVNQLTNIDNLRGLLKTKDS